MTIVEISCNKRVFKSDVMKYAYGRANRLQTHNEWNVPVWTVGYQTQQRTDRQSFPTFPVHRHVNRNNYCYKLLIIDISVFDFIVNSTSKCLCTLAMPVTNVK